MKGEATDNGEGDYKNFGDEQVEEGSEEELVIDSRQGQRFFGCCDMRRAVIIVNIVSIMSIAIQNIVYYTVGMNLGYSGTVRPELGDVFGWLLPTVVLSAQAMVGATKYQEWMVIINGYYQAIYMLLYLFLLDIPAAILCCVVCYPHFVLAQELRDGIMSPNRYVQEEYSCCCL